MFNRNKKEIKKCKICNKEFEAYTVCKNTKYCNKCRKKAYAIKAKDNYEKVKERKIIYQRKYRIENPLQQKRWREKNKYIIRKYIKTYNANHTKERIEYQKKHVKKYPEKIIARNTAKYKIALGKTCEICGSLKNLERHHPDYSKPLKVMTLCKKCHTNIHTR